METQELPELVSGEWYLALPRTEKPDILTDSAADWVIVQYIVDDKRTGFTLNRNLNIYPIETFARFVKHPLIGILTGYKDKVQKLERESVALKTICQKEVDRKKAKQCQGSLIDELLKVTYAAVDNVNSDMGMSCGDLESNNARLVKIVTQLRDRGVEP